MSDKTQEALGRIEGLLELMVPMIQKNEERVSAVEKKVSRHSGIIATVATGFTALVAFLSDW